MHNRYGERKLPELLRELCKIEKLHWIRVHYLYPDEMTDELIDVIASEPKIVKYMDIPIQHVNDRILKRMNRRGTRAELDELFARLRERIPGVVIRTSLITGLPGEGEAEFDELCDWLRVHKLERVGAFAFSPEEGTAAAKMEHPDEETAAHRAEIVSELQSRKRTGILAGPTPIPPTSTAEFVSTARQRCIPAALYPSESPVSATAT